MTKTVIVVNELNKPSDEAKQQLNKQIALLAKRQIKKSIKEAKTN